MTRAVILGGCAEGKSVLEPVAHAVCDAGYAEDADVITLRYGMKNPDKVRSAVFGQFVMPHSAGLMNVAPEFNPDKVLAFNGPEPRRIPRLIASAIHKTANHGGTALAGPDRAAALRAFSSNTLNIFPDLKYLPEISRFSSSERLRDIAEAGATAVGHVITLGDEYFPPHLHPRADLDVVLIDGEHDEVLLRPGKVLQHVAEMNLFKPALLENL